MTTLLAALFTLASIPAAQSGQSPDIAGKWDLTVVTSHGERPASLTITRSGDKLAGTITAPQGEVPVDITLQKNAITISFTTQGQNGSVNIVMSGTVDGDQMRGEVDMGGRGSGTWTARRTSSAAPPAESGSQEKPPPTMTGTWTFEVNHSAGTSTPTVTITQTGEKLSGKYAGSYGQAELTGSIKGSEFTFSVDVGTEQKVTLVYTGTLSGDTVKGNVTMGEMGEGTFSGKRK